MCVLDEEENPQAITCYRCQQLFNYDNDRVPKYLSCMHTLCQACVTELSEENNHDNGSIACPICHQLTIKRDNQSVHSCLPTNFRLFDLLPETSVCDNCETSVACLKCLDCDYDCSRLCDGCALSHKKFKVFREHRLVALAQQPEEDKDDANNIRKSNQTVKKKEMLPLCSKHSTKHHNMYCISCRETLCLSCAAFGHESHIILSHNESVTFERESVVNAMNTLESNMGMLCQSKGDIQKNESLLEDQKQSILDDTNASFTVLMTQLNSHREILLLQVKIRCNQYQISVQDRIDSISTSILACKRHIQTVAFHISSSSISCHEYLQVNRLLRQSFLDITCAYKSYVALLSAIFYCDSTFKEFEQLIPAHVTCRNDMNNPATVNPDKCSFEVVLNGSFTPGLWRLVLLLTLRNNEISTLNTGSSPTAGHIPVVVTPEVIPAAGTGTIEESLDGSELLKKMHALPSADKTDVGDNHNDNVDPSTTTTPEVNFSVDVVDNRKNGTYYISVSSEPELEITSNLLTHTFNHEISISVKVYDAHVQGSPYRTCMASLATRTPA